MCEQTSETPAGVQSWRRRADEEPLARAETILFVEDEAFVREVTSEVLRSAGYQVLTAQSAAEAVRIYDARHGDVELLLTDVVLPRENGRAMAGRLRRRNPALKVLLVTGYGEQMGRREAALECLAKPFSAEVLLSTVRGMLDGEGVAEGLAVDSKSRCRRIETTSDPSAPSLALRLRSG